MAVTFRDECVEAWLQRPKPTAQAYARAQWAFLNGSGPNADPRQHGITDAAAQAIRVRLAQAMLVIGTKPKYEKYFSPKPGDSDIGTGAEAGAADVVFPAGVRANCRPGISLNTPTLASIRITR